MINWREGFNEEILSTFIKAVIILLSIWFLYSHYTRQGIRPKVIQTTEPNFTLLSPRDITKHNSKDNYYKLLNITNFTFTLNSQPCRNDVAGLLLVVIVSSNPRRYNYRSAIRTTWGRSTDFAKLVFLVGETNDRSISRRILNESLKYGDIVQGNFVDAYRNMTYKHLMGLKWAAHHCAAARYVLKADDDVVVNSRELWHLLTRELSPWGARKLMLCYAMVGSKVVRSSTGGGAKWRVSVEEIPDEYYPTYCLGPFVLYSQDVISQLLETAQTLRYFWIDDVFVTGYAARKIGVFPTDLGESFYEWNETKFTKPYYNSKSAKRFLMGPIDVSEERMKTIWKALGTIKP